MTDKQPKRPVGRPPEPVPWDKAEALLAHMEAGGTFTGWCALPGNPVPSTVWRWSEKDTEFAQKFAQARHLQGYVLVDGAQDLMDHAQTIADNAANDWAIDEKGNTKLNHEHVQRSKLRVETMAKRADLMLKRAACFCPSLFGTRVQMEGVKGGEAIKVERSGPPEPAVTDLASEIQQLGQLVAQHLPK